MRRSLRVLMAAILLGSFAAHSLPAYRLIYKEQLYELYRVQMYQYPERIRENIYRLEQALSADFANPLNALAVIEDETDWERYRYLFWTHLNLKLVELYLRWASKYTKQVAYFYNYPWRDQNLESLDRAEHLMNQALYYWDEAQRWSAQAWELRGVHLEEVQYWADENHRIETGDLDYQAIIQRHLDRLEETRAAFQAMGPDTY
ncbi:MAG: hypothetical protein ACLFO1_02325 [Spirochaetaceae bacterium]